MMMMSLTGHPSCSDQGHAYRQVSKLRPIPRSVYKNAGYACVFHYPHPPSEEGNPIITATTGVSSTNEQCILGLNG